MRGHMLCILGIGPICCVGIAICLATVLLFAACCVPLYDDEFDALAFSSAALVLSVVMCCQLGEVNRTV